MQWVDRPNWLAYAAAFSLSGCGMVDDKSDTQPRLNAPVSTAPSDGVSDITVKIGEPYQINGITYTPMDDPAYDETGYASWYGEERAGNVTANGEPFSAAAITAAHRTLPLPSYVEVTALNTGRTILVRVNDRGPFAGDRVIDLSRGAAEQLGISQAGSSGVRVRRVNPTEPEKGQLRSGMRAPARMDMPETVLVELRKRLPIITSASATPGSERIAASPQPTIKQPAKPTPAMKKPSSVPIKGEKPLSLATKARLQASAPPILLQIGAYSTRQRAEEVAKRLGGIVSPAGKLWRVRTGPYSDAAAARSAIEKSSAAGFPGGRIVVND